jgi:hypothetical protein
VSVHLARRIVSLGCAAAVALAGCGGAASPSSATPSAPAASASEPAASPSETASILEDAGLETNLTPGRYTSRVFAPTLTIELGDGWLRRDTGDSRKLDLRHGAGGRDDLTFIAGIDFMQCGTAAVVEKPNAAAIIEALTTSTLLTVSDPVDVTVGDRTARMIRLTGGDPIPDADLMRSNEFGCVLTVGPEAFPAEGLWIMATTAQTVQHVVLDIDGTTVLIAAKSADDVNAWWDAVIDVLKTTTLG